MTTGTHPSMAHQGRRPLVPVTQIASLLTRYLDTLESVSRHALTPEQGQAAVRELLREMRHLGYDGT